MDSTRSLQIHIETYPFLNIALHLNNIKPIISLSLENEGETDSPQVDLLITSDIPCIEEFRYSVTIPANMEVKIPLDDLRIKREFFNQLTESEKTQVTVSVIDGDELLAEHRFELDVYPLEYFGGFEYLPELIAAYVTPNHPYVYHIKRNAADLLEQQGQNVSFDGYQQDDPKRVLQIISAIFSAIQNESLIYSSLPPGYEATGQRLRLLSTIQRERFANCIDLSLLFAACLEAADLNPIIIIVKNHAFVGCWLTDDKFATIVNDDQTAITKRLARGIREIVVVEATSLCRGADRTFKESVDLGEAQLIENENFLLSVDIKRARTAFIRPLPILVTANNEVALDEELVQKYEASNLQLQFELGAVYGDELLNRPQRTTKIKIWERKLLDLSLRNNLLNLRLTRNMLQLIDIDISHLEDTLSEGKSFSILPNQRAQIGNKYNVYKGPLHRSSPTFVEANDELKYNRLLTYYHTADLDNILTYIYKNAKLSIEENGASTLFLAVGLLRWYDRKTPEQERLAPILLLPVELSRRSVNSNFTLRSSGEETMINITLLEFLRQEYQLDLGALEELPYDDKGVDVGKIMGSVRRAVMNLKGWDVLEQLILGNFSFNKLILWKDIVSHQEELKKSPIVRSLIDGELSKELVISADHAIGVDEIESSTLALPIDCDVSQKEAVWAASKGESFILHGPPGTGKSQTITNIIADALYRGKRVLFVAAKKAALDVVHKRLEQIGLGAFTLELHSNKTKKSEVLDQLAKSLEATKAMRSRDFVEESRRLDEAKQKIGEYVNLLHRKQPVGWSLYEAISNLEALENLTFGDGEVPTEVYQTLDRATYLKWTDWLSQFKSIINLIVHPAQNPLSFLKVDHYTPSFVQETGAAVQAVLDVFSKLEVKVGFLARELRVPCTLSDSKTLEEFIALLTALEQSSVLPLSFCRLLTDRGNVKLFNDWGALFEQYVALKTGLGEQFGKSIFEQDLSEIEFNWRQAQTQWFLRRWLDSRKIKSHLKALVKRPLRTHAEVEALFEQKNEFAEVQLELNSDRFRDIQTQLGILFQGDDTNVGEIKSKVADFTNVINLINKWSFNGIDDWLGNLEKSGIKYFDDLKNKYGKDLTGAIRDYGEFSALVEKHSTLENVFANTTSDFFKEAGERLRGIQNRLPSIRDWYHYVMTKRQSQPLQLDWMIRGYEENRYPREKVEEYFHYAVNATIIKNVIAQHEALSLFNPELFKSRIEDYKRIARLHKKLTIQEIRGKLAEQLPNLSFGIAQTSEVGILLRAIRNRGRGLSIRKLFEQVPTLLPRLVPCMLMSPISAAQYFDVNTDHFDLVIFDEASQLPTCEAVSSLARAKQAIIVGDPKQMPPTSFFSTIRLDEENMDLEDLESILDDCLSLTVPSRYLLRHYRSKHESLISFSNINYYDSKLLTFPSADDLNQKVVYHHVTGFYDKGKSRTNKFEAGEIVEFIKKFYESGNRERSIGVVTFSQTQQSLVEELLQQLYLSDPKLEEHFTQGEEPLFVKNLENVQGDERDIILFSVGYAPDQEGKISMNFGPLNRNGGWRRLNVAVTRARYEMHIFATLRSDQIDLSRSSAEGVLGLKEFLRFAEGGHLNFRAERNANEAAYGDLSSAIARELSQHGLTVRTNVGTSGFRMDVGVVHPKYPDRYILGIILDGHHYYNAKTVDDREMVIPSVLSSLGWKIYRLWSLDWIENSSKIVREIVDRVAELSELELQEGADMSNDVSDRADEPDFYPEVVREEPVESEPFQEAASTKRREYVGCDLEYVVGASSETIYHFTNRNIIKRQIQQILEVESPISKGLLCKKILSAWFTSRMGGKLESYLDDIIHEVDLTERTHLGQVYYWKPGMTEIDFYRVGEGSDRRNIEDIAPEELKVAILEAIDQYLSIELEELLRHTARIFGFAKLGRQIDLSLRYTIDLMVQENLVRIDGGRVRRG